MVVSEINHINNSGFYTDQCLAIWTILFSKGYSTKLNKSVYKINDNSESVLFFKLYFKPSQVGLSMIVIVRPRYRLHILPSECILGCMYAIPRK